MTGLNVLKKIWVKIWGEDIPPQQEVFENKNANLFKSFYTKIRNKLVFRRLAIVLFLLIATCLTFNYLKYFNISKFSKYLFAKKVFFLYLPKIF